MKKILVLAALLGTASAASAQDTTYDARSLGMGGVGAASANSLNAIYENPAALASLPNEKFAFEIPIVSVRLLDADGLLSNIDSVNTSATALNTALTNFQNAVTVFQNTPNPTTQTALQTSAGSAGVALGNFSNSMATVSNKSLMGSFFGGTMLAASRPSFSFALMLDARAEMGGLFDYSNADNTTITNLSTALVSCSSAAGTAQTLAQCNAAVGGIGAGGQVNNLTSSFNVRGAMLKEVGVTAARHVDNWGDIDLGITPKFIQLTSYDYSTSAQSGNTKMSLSSGEKKDSLFTFDLGAAKTFNLNKESTVKAGVVAKNALAKTATTVNGNEIRIAPQLTAGVAYTRSWFTGTADLDVIKNKAMIAGFGKDSQFLRLGTELNAWGFAQFRLGYRHDLAGNYAGLPSVGLGLFHVFDLSVAAAGKKEAAATMQFGIRF